MALGTAATLGIMGGSKALEALAAYLGGRPSKFQKRSRAKFGDVSEQLERGITPGDISSIMPRLRAAAMPGVNRAVGRSAARFGGSAGATGATAIRSLTESTAPALAQLSGQALLGKQQNLRQLAALLAQLS